MKYEEKGKKKRSITRRDLLKAITAGPAMAFIPLASGAGDAPRGSSETSLSNHDSPGVSRIAMEPFTVDWRESSGGMVDVSFLLQAPAGKDGFIRVSGGHLVKPDGERFRIWGVNVTRGAAMPPKRDAPGVAAYLARYGVNGIRFHWLDAFAPAGLIESNRNDSQHLNPKQLDRLDFFIAELKKHGIYADLNLNVARRYKQGDGVRDYELLGIGPKALTYFDPRLLELQRQYARKLLTHYNPYTQSEYCNEPAVLMIELVNENSIVEAWVNGRLLGKNTHKHPGAWTDIPASYAKELTEQYNAWLSRTLTAEELGKFRALAGVPEGALVTRLQPSEFAAAPAEQFETEAQFYMDLEHHYFRSMGAYLKKELGVKSLVIGTRADNRVVSPCPLLWSTSQLDIVDGHYEWDHPKVTVQAGRESQRKFTIHNTAMVNDPFNSTVAWLSSPTMAGKPYTVSEYNNPFPNEYRVEGIPILAAYAAFQDWDGALCFAFEQHNPDEWQRQALDFFAIEPDPAKMAQLAAGALIYLRPDVRPAEKTIVRSFSVRQVFESLRARRRDHPHFGPGFPLYVPLQHGCRIGEFGRESIPDLPATTDNPIRSDTNELAWYTSGAKAGLVSVDTAYSQALIGFARAHQLKLRNLLADVLNRFCALTLSSLDGQPLSRSARMLLTAVALAQNTGMKWNPTRKSLVDWGTLPTEIEPVIGTITLRNLADVKRVEAIPLDGASRQLGASCPVKETPQGWEVKVGKPATTWYVIRVER